MYEKLMAFLKEHKIRIEIVVSTERPGISGHPIAISEFLKFLMTEYNKK